MQFTDNNNNNDNGTARWIKPTWGVHKLKITSANVNLTQKGNGFMINTEFMTEAGASARYVNLGWFKKLETAEDSKQLDNAEILVSEMATLRKETYNFEKDSEEAIAHQAKITAKFEEIKLNKFTSLADSFNDLFKFIAAFGCGAELAKLGSLDHTNQMSFMSKAVDLMVDKEAYALVMLSQYEKDGKVYDSFNFGGPGQSFASPMAWSTSAVKEVNIIHEELTDDLGEPIVDAEGNAKLGDLEKCEVWFDGLDKPKVIKPDNKNYVVLVQETNDSPADEDYEDDNLPF